MLYGDLLLLLSLVGAGLIYGENRPFVSLFLSSMSLDIEPVDIGRIRNRGYRSYNVDIPHLGSLGHPLISGVLSLLLTVSSPEV